MTDAAFYCVSSEVYFPAAVGLVNSLRLTGHDEPIFLLDCGLTPEHRALVEPHVTVVDAPDDTPPYLLKTVAPRLHPASLQVLIDVDIVVTRPLGPLFEQLANATVFAVKDRLDRFVPEWGELLDLGALRRAPYVSSGFVGLRGDAGSELLELWDDRLGRVDYERSYFAGDVAGYPFRYIDQDVLNAVIAARIEAERAAVIDPELFPTPPFRALRVADEATLRTVYSDGSEPHAVHQFVRKPWLEPMYHSIYSRLLARLLTGDDVAIRMPPEEVPRRMRRGAAALVERRLTDAADLARWYARDVIPEWLEQRRERRRAGGETP